MKPPAVFVLCLLALTGCSKEPPPITLLSKLPLDSEAAVKNPSALLEGLSFVPANQPLNKKDLSAVSAMVLQCHALALAEGEEHLKIKKSWLVFHAVDISLREQKAWREFRDRNRATDSMDAN